MGFFKKLFGGGELVCPFCGRPGAKQTPAGIRCPNPQCANYNPEEFGASQDQRAAEPFTPPSGKWSPASPVEIRYTNYRGESRTFTAERDSLVRRKEHIVAKVAPTGRAITLARKRINNLGEVEAAMPRRVEPGQDWPSPRERQVLGYHKKHGTTSPLYEKIRAKYPNW